MKRERWTDWARRTIAATVAVTLAGPAPALGQMHKVEKKESVVRAVGVYEWTGDLAKPTGSRFVPVTIFIDGEIEDAGVYQPRPVPFALLTGNVYELEDAGLGKGLVVLEQAMKAESPEGAAAPSFIDGWTAYGSYKVPAPPKRAAALHASKTLSTIQTSGSKDDGRPHLNNKSGDSSAKSDSSAKGDSSTKPDASTKTTTASSDDSRPTLHRRTDTPTKVDDETTAPDDPNAAASLPKDTGDDDSDRAERPTLRRRSMDEIAADEKDKAQKKKKQQNTASVTAAGKMADDPDRPRLKRNTKSEEDEEQPKLMGVPAGMRQMVAVSDAKNRSPHVFARPWDSMEERAQILTQMQGFARAKLAAYGVVHGIVPPQAVAATSGTVAGAGVQSVVSEGSGPPKLKRGVPTDDTTEGSVTAVKSAPASGDPAPPKLKRGIPTDNTTMTAADSSARTASAKTAASTASKTAASTTAKKTTTTAAHKGRKATAAKAPEVQLADEELRGYTLSYGGAPTYVYTAHTVEPDAVTRYITVVAQADPTGQLKVAIASATDAAHLDQRPWMRPIDAVDVEASNRASLLFELRGQSSRQFALYRVIAAKSEQIFPEPM